MKTPYTEEFEAFWKAYPYRIRETSLGEVKIKADKIGAFEEWQKLSKTDREAALSNIDKADRGKWTLDARRWLKRERWEDEVLVTVATKCHRCGKPAAKARQDDTGQTFYVCADWPKCGAR
jgi:hypothetical protein